MLMKKCVFPLFLVGLLCLGLPCFIGVKAQDTYIVVEIQSGNITYDETDEPLKTGTRLKDGDELLFSSQKALALVYRESDLELLHMKVLRPSFESPMSPAKTGKVGSNVFPLEFSKDVKLREKERVLNNKYLMREFTPGKLLIFGDSMSVNLSEEYRILSDTVFFFVRYKLDNDSLATRRLPHEGQKLILDMRIFEKPDGTLLTAEEILALPYIRIGIYREASDEAQILGTIRPWFLETWPSFKQKRLDELIRKGKNLKLKTPDMMQKILEYAQGTLGKSPFIQSQNLRAWLQRTYDFK